MMKGIVFSFCMVALCAVAACLLWLAFGGGADEEGVASSANPKPEVVAVSAEVKSAAATSKKKAAPAKPATAGKKSVKNRPVHVEPYSPADQKLSDAVQSALDEEKFADVVTAAEAAMKSENPEVRGEAVDALGWFGEKSIVPLTKAMLDADEGVAENARGQVESALMAMDDARAAFDLAASFVDAFDADAGAIAMFEGIMTASANQIIDPDDAESADDVQTARANRLKIVETLQKMIDKGGRLETAARSAYEQITGEAWTNAGDAERWINEPDLPEDAAADEGDAPPEDEADAGE